MRKEIELKIKVSSDQLTIIKEWLNKNAKFVGEFNIHDCYLDNPKSSFFFESDAGKKDALKFLRVRFDKTNGDSVCFKNWHLDKESGTTTHCDETEFNVSSGKAALSMFQSLGYEKDSVRIKNRKKYDTGKLEIAIDNIEDNGIFSGLYVEIEIKDDSIGVENGRKYMFDFLKSIGINQIKMQTRGSGKMEDVDI